jgi:1-aminocyclopropane-1-carboxylate deaminase/D-cysteine desulfhydrase-like pyridoxal-dependent ACC family enzyme
MLPMMLARLPRLRLAHLPTPLEDLPRLTAALGGPRLLIKRDDLTGLALGGNKARKLEYLLGAARAAGATAVLTTAGAHSNYLRMTAAAARKAGLRPVLFLRGTGREPRQGNLLLDEIVGAELRFIDVRDPWSPAAPAIMAAAAAELAARGERPFVISVQTTHAPLAAIGYVAAALELHGQLVERGQAATHLFLPTSSGVTQAGLVLGARLLRWPLQVVGIAVTPGQAAFLRQRVGEIVAGAARLLELPDDPDPGAVIVEEGYAGPAYGAVTPAAARAIRLLGEQEGIILDPVYSGKAMAGLLDWHARGRLAGADTAIFLHTGGAPNLFTQAELLAAALARS